jgi:sulfur-oxidizing protein SoxY
LLGQHPACFRAALLTERREVDDRGWLRNVDALGQRRLCTRRGAMRTTAAGAAAWAVWACLPRAAVAATVAEALEELLGGRPAAESARVRLELPDRFDYGNTVPLAFSVASPMTAADHVRRVDVFAEGNPFPEVATFYFTPESGRAGASTRIRLNEGEQEVIAVAELSDGSAWIGRRAVQVSISGCSAEPGVAVAQPMPTPKPRLHAPAEVGRDQIVEIKTMISHRMETGLRTDAQGHPIPRRIISRMTCSRDDRLIFAADLSPAIAANAYLNFYIMARASGALEFAWHEDGGAVYRAARPLAAV